MKYHSVDEWLDWFNQVHPLEMDLRLDRMQEVSRSLAIAAPVCRVITVGGTNGKGSTVTYLESIYRAAGYRVGATLSPHLQHFNERIRVDAQALDDAALCAIFARIEQARGAVALTYFEFAILAAMLAFVDAQVDVAILEVGLGGRLDACNLWDADVAIVTNIAIDHEQWLGTGRDRIGREKAGIARAKRPLLVGDRHPPEGLLTAADEIGAKVMRLGVDFDYERDENNQYFVLMPEAVTLAQPQLFGHWQLENAALAAQAVMTLPQLPVSTAQLSAGIASASIPGRFECRMLANGATLVLDVGHNPAAAQAGASALAALRQLRGAKRCLAVSAIMQDKDYRAVAQIWQPLVDQWYLGALDMPRALDPEHYAQVIAECAGQSDCFADIATALEAACSVAQGDDILLVFGSFYTVVAAQQALQNSPLRQALAS